MSPGSGWRDSSPSIHTFIQAEDEEKEEMEDVTCHSPSAFSSQMTSERYSCLK